jgi:hypothetical protein
MGPIAVFDKSFLQMLNLDEAAIFDALYSAVICPIFYTEVLADLAKAPSGQRTVERIVADLANKTPIMHSTPNVLHSSICMTELNGGRIDMRRVPVRAGGKPVRMADGKVGVLYDEAPEAKAFARWQRQQFREVEREFASQWRQQLAASDNGATAKLVKRILAIHSNPRDLDEALEIAKEVVHGDGQRFRTLKTAFVLLGLPQSRFPGVQRRWTSMGGPRLTDFAPYTAHCLLVDVFFHVAVDKKMIAPERASNRVDMAYLYYLPFSMMFVSNDKLHRRTVPLFLNDQQLFVIGDELKRDLAALDDYYSGRPEEEREQGLFRLAAYPPEDDSFLTTRIWKQFGMPTKRALGKIDPLPFKTPAKEFLTAVRAMKEQAKADLGPFTPTEMEDPDQMVIERMIPLQRGKWRLMPPGVKPDAP